MIREAIADMRDQKNAMITAHMANSAFMKTEEGPAERNRIIQEYEDHFREMVDAILNPEEPVDLSANPLFAAGLRGLEKLKWDIESGNAPQV